MKRLPLLLVAAGAAALLFTACATNPGAGPAESEPAADPVGDWGKIDEMQAPSLSLRSNGKLAGTDGCNRLMGSWTQEEDTIDFGQVASTRRACPDLENVWLTDLATATITGTTMTIYNSSGDEIGTLERSTARPTNTPDS